MKDISFGHFRLDFTNECLWQGDRSISLRPKAFAVLKVLLQTPGQLVNKQQVLDAVWPGTFVGDAVLKDNVRQLREALLDDAGSPGYIETVHRRGYRFIAKISDQVSASATDKSPNEITPMPSEVLDYRAIEAGSQLLGRETELEKMRASLTRALSGERQTIFITGEAGIGKTTLVEAFIQQATRATGALVLRGQCQEHFGLGEAYLPFLEGFSRLCRSSAGEQVLDVLRHLAPSWLAHLSSLYPPSQREQLQPQGPSASRERMLREMAEAIDKLTEHTPLIVVLEDLHWSDFSTIDLVASLARRRDPGRLMVIGTYRPVDVVLAGHPLKDVKRELQAHRLCLELPLEYLTEEAVASYLNTRLPRHQFPGRLARTIYHRTEGNPLFMTRLVEYLIDQKVIVEEQGGWTFRADFSEVEHGVPSSVQELIEKQIERLSAEERAVLEAASSTGTEFSTVAVAAGLAMPRDWVEKHCEELARRHQFLSPSWLGELPDGTISPRHSFNHVLYRDVPYSLIPPMRRAQIHQRIAERAVEIFRERANEIAAELAMHFEQSRDWPRAVQFLIAAAKNATNRSAHHEAEELATRGLEALRLLPDSRERAQQEITLRMMLSLSQITNSGFAAVEVARIYSLAQELCWHESPSPQLFNMHYLLVLFHMFSGQMEQAESNSRKLLQIADAVGDPALAMEAHRAMGASLIEQGKCVEALDHFDKALTFYPSNHNHPHTLTIAHDCKVVCESFAGRALLWLGRPDEALERIQRALVHGRELCHPRSWVLAAHFACQLHQVRGEPLLALDRAREVAQVADEYGLDFWAGVGTFDLGWAEAELGNPDHGIEQMQKGLHAHMASGAKLWCPQLLCEIAAQMGRAERFDEALGIVNEGLRLAAEAGELYPVRELERTKADIVSQFEFSHI